HSGDLTTDALGLEEQETTATARAKSDLVVCGGDVFIAAFRRLQPNTRFDAHVADGAFVTAGADLWTVRGGAAAVLMAERAALNLVQRMSGISTLTRRFVGAIPAGCHTRITDTRKTTPGLRALERYAVRMGGGHNHRDNLGSA